MTDRTSNTPYRYVFFWSVNDNFPWVENQVEPVYIKDEPFTKSNGTVMSRIYERLTKHSRRDEQSGLWPDYGHDAYRQGVYDTLKALQEELR